MNTPLPPGTSLEPAQPLFGPPRTKARNDRLKATIQGCLSDPVVAVAWFLPNATAILGGFGAPGLLLTAVTWLAQRFAIHFEGGVAPRAVWVITPSKLYIFDARQTTGFPFELRRRVGAWDRRAVHVQRVKEQVGRIRGDPSFAVRLNRPDGGQIEMRALRHEQAAFDVIQMLVDPAEAAAALHEAQRRDYRQTMKRWRSIRLTAQTILAIGLLVVLFVMRARG